MAFGKLKGFINGDDEVIEETKDDEFYNVTRDGYKEANGGLMGNKMILLEPRAYSESQQIADYLKNRNAVVVNLKRVTPDQAKRIVDFLSGTLYAIKGDLQKLGGGIFLCTPSNVDVEGKITDDAKPVKGKAKDKEEEEFNW